MTRIGNEVRNSGNFDTSDSDSDSDSDKMYDKYSEKNTLMHVYDQRWNKISKDTSSSKYHKHVHYTIMQWFNKNLAITFQRTKRRQHFGLNKIFLVNNLKNHWIRISSHTTEYMT